MLTPFLTPLEIPDVKTILSNSRFLINHLQLNEKTTFLILSLMARSQDSYSIELKTDSNKPAKN